MDNLGINKKKTKTQEKLLCEDRYSTALTLDVLLNLIDGLREACGRILIITTNYKARLDPALIRAGRVDLDLEFKKADKEQFSQIYKAYFFEEIPEMALA